MSSEAGELSILLFHALSVVIFVIGITIDFILIFLVQTRRLAPALAGRNRVANSPFKAFHVQLVMAVTLFFALAAAFQTSTEPVQDRVLISGALLYAVMACVAISFCLLYSRVSFKDAFLAPSCSTWRAAKKGLLYGLAVIPPIAGLSICVSAAFEALGIPAQPQALFEWLKGEPALGPRLFMMAAAVVIAPVAEELLFRGVLFAAVLKTRAFMPAALLTGFYFALVHLHALSFLPLLALGVAFAAGYAATGSIVTPIVMHAVFNTASLVFYLAAPL